MKEIWYKQINISTFYWYAQWLLITLNLLTILWENSMIMIIIDIFILIYHIVRVWYLPWSVHLSPFHNWYVAIKVCMNRIQKNVYGRTSFFLTVIFFINSAELAHSIAMGKRKQENKKPVYYWWNVIFMEDRTSTFHYILKIDEEGKIKSKAHKIWTKKIISYFGSLYPNIDKQNPIIHEITLATHRDTAHRTH